MAASSLDVLDYPDTGRKLEPAEVLARTPEVDRVADCVPFPFRAVGSTSIGPKDWVEIGRAISGLGPDVTGVVILHGTATLEETAYALSLTLKTEMPVVLVGAQRPSSAVSSDAGMNLVAAIRTAIAPEARDLGVLVVLNDEIHAAREVTKTSTYRLQTFRSPDFGLLGHVDGDRVAFYR
ncbi:MAG: asparaginase, partial [Thermomicrobiales bacterium]